MNNNQTEGRHATRTQQSIGRIDPTLTETTKVAALVAQAHSLAAIADALEILVRQGRHEDVMSVGESS